MALVIADVGIKADAAGIAVAKRIVEPERLGKAEWAVPGCNRSGHAVGVSSPRSWLGTPREASRASQSKRLFGTFCAMGGGMVGFFSRRRRGGRSAAFGPIGPGIGLAHFNARPGKETVMLS